MKYKKKIVLLSIALVSVITFSSCKSNNNSIYELKPEYANKIKKGKKVDSVSFEVIDNDEKKKITITADDSYDDAVQKMWSDQYHGAISPAQNKSDGSQYPIFTRDKIIYKSSNDGYTRESNATMYNYDFLVGNTIIYDNNNNLKDKWLDRGVYSSWDNSNDSHSYECATNYIDDKHVIGCDGTEDELNEFLKNDKSMYINIKSADRYEVMNLRSARYCYDKFYYSPSKIGVYGPTGTGFDTWNNDFVYGLQTGYPVPACLINRASNNASWEPYLDEKINKYFNFEASIELTSNFIIFKHKVNKYLINLISNDVWALGDYDNIPYDEFEEKYFSNDNIMNSYVQEEIWFDYKNSLIYDESTNSTVNNIRYSYYNYFSTLKDDYQKDYYYEAYKLDLSESKINKKKNSFINKCKKNNVLDKYPFKMV